MTIREHLQQVERQLGHKPEELIEPCKFPTPLSYLWVAFCRLSNRRTPDGAITFSEIKAWKDLLEVKTSPWEIEALLALDEVYLRVQREK